MILNIIVNGGWRIESIYARTITLTKNAILRSLTKQERDGAVQILPDQQHIALCKTLVAKVFSCVSHAKYAAILTLTRITMIILNRLTYAGFVGYTIAKKGLT